MIGSATGTDLVDLRATGNAAVAGQLLGRAILIRSAGLDLAQSGAIGSGASETIDVQATGNANVAGQVLGGDILLSAAALNLPAPARSATRPRPDRLCARPGQWTATGACSAARSSPTPAASTKARPA